MNKKQMQNCRGYTLIELAIVMTIVGILTAPAVMLYSVYMKDKRATQTRNAVLEARYAIDGFRGIYGRYPCPSRMDAVPGDIDYGYESRDPVTGACLIVPGIASAPSSNAAVAASANPDVYIGSLPFRQMNLPSEYVHDGYNTRLTYAVTGLLTDDATYASNMGGITVLDVGGNQATDLPDSAHFVLLSHNINNDGGISRDGVVIGACPAGTLEEENCNMDATFRVGQVQADFDDLVHYNRVDSLEQWQISDTDRQDIHLRRATSTALGIRENDPIPSTFAALEVKQRAPTVHSDGIIFASTDTVSLVSGAYLLAELCNQTGGGGAPNCFAPELIGGMIYASVLPTLLSTPTGGMACPAGEFAYKVDSGQIRCVPEVFFNCPAGNFITGFDANGQIICDAPPPPTCPVANLNTTCNDTRSVTPFFSNGTWYGYGYSGECYDIAPLSAADVATINSLPSIAAIQAYVATLNDAPRTSRDCGPASTDALVRDTFQCDATGSWITTPILSLERGAPGTVLSGFSPTPPAPNMSGGGSAAETSGAVYNPAAPMSTDAGNTGTTHDCWCRQDYRVSVQNCPGPAVGQQYRIRRYDCPQTETQSTTTVLAWNTRFCGCVPGTTSNTLACHVYFGAPANSTNMTGNVIRNYDVTCPAGPGGPPTQTLTSVDTSACTCPARQPNIATTACPFGTTNSFTYGGANYTGVAQIFQSNWICPTGPAPAPASAASHAGYYGPSNLVHTEPCTCNSALTQNVTVACPTGYAGTGQHHTVPWNCTTGAFDPPSAATLVTDDCYTCSWQGGAPTGLSSFAAPNTLGAGCTSQCGTVGTCSVQAGTQYQIYSGCVCTPN